MNIPMRCIGAVANGTIAAKISEIATAMPAAVTRSPGRARQTALRRGRLSAKLHLA
jgi:hypothetical protein